MLSLICDRVRCRLGLSTCQIILLGKEPLENRLESPGVTSFSVYP